MNQCPSDGGLPALTTSSRILANFRRNFGAMLRDSNGFSVAKIVVASFVTHFDVVKPPIGWMLIHFSKTTS
jgi:hypothetical protein